MSEIEKMATTVAELATPDMRPRQLIKAVRKLYPDASKKEITRAAFYAVIKKAETAPQDVEGLHKLAFDTRNALDEDGEIEQQKE